MKLIKVLQRTGSLTFADNFFFKKACFILITSKVVN